jgi:hypothetical protein
LEDHFSDAVQVICFSSVYLIELQSFCETFTDRKSEIEKDRNNEKKKESVLILKELTYKGSKQKQRNRKKQKKKKQIATHRTQIKF